MKILRIIFLFFSLLIKDENSLPIECLLTFDNQTNLSTQINCPSTCFTIEYLTNHNQYPIYGNETYSGNSLICKSSIHDGRIAPWMQHNSSIQFQLNSIQSSIYLSTLRNGILSSKSTSIPLNSYSIINNRINESSVLDIAIEHRGYIYKSNSSSSITCRGSSSQMKIQPIEIDQGWKIWKENSIKYFTHPRGNLTRNQAIEFCRNNNGTLFYWNNSNELNFIQNQISTTISQLFHSQISSNSFLQFYIGFKQINQIKQWQDNIINYNENLYSIEINSTFNSNEDYCTLIQYSTTTTDRSFQILTHQCQSQSTSIYPLCRLKPSVEISDTRLIYRLELDNQKGNLTGVTNFCSELGGYPIYGNNAYEWHLIQEIMLKDKDFIEDYVYTGLISENQQETNSYWVPTNISYNSSLSYLWFGESRGSGRIGYHLSRTRGESYYKLYDINPHTVLNQLRFCRKENLQILIKDSLSCSSKQCQTSSCLNKTFPIDSTNLRFSFYACLPMNSLSSIVYTHSFPFLGDFIRPILPMNYSVSLREQFHNQFIFQFNQTDKDLDLECFQYLNFDIKQTLNDSLKLVCDRSKSINKTFQGISLKKNFNGLVSIGFSNRRMSSHHFRFIDYYSNSIQCNSQGIIHPTINQCICSPGFYGDKCQYSCPSGYYGQSCSYECFGDDPYCKGLLICLPDPYGCSCYSGWYGTQCDLICPKDHYGPNCLYKCSCNECNRFTGVCNCEGSECYSGPISRKSLESLCKTSSNLIVLIVVPIVSIIVLIGIIGGFIFWKKKHSADEENLVEQDNRHYSQDSSFNDNYIISERL